MQLPATVAWLVLSFVPQDPTGHARFRGVARAWGDAVGPGRRAHRPLRRAWVLAVAGEGFGGDTDAALGWAVDAGLVAGDAACALAASLGAVAVLGRFRISPHPRSCSGSPITLGQELIAAAAARGHVRILDRLALPPHSLGQRDARAIGAIIVAAETGWVSVLDRLALPPYDLGAEDASACVSAAASHGRVAVLDRLALPPFGQGGEAARARRCEALRLAARGDHVRVLDRLARPPYLLDKVDARCVSIMPGLSDRVVARLGRPPYLRAVPDTPVGV